MIVDLHLKGKQVVVVGGGREARRKIEALFSQDCEIVVITEKASPEMERWAEEGKIQVQKMRVEDGRFLHDFERLILVMMATDDAGLNRTVSREAKKLGYFAYSVDDSETSDFAHPAVINVRDAVQIAISTGGKSPLMAKAIKDKVAPKIKDLITPEDIQKIRLQEALRTEAKKALSTLSHRKKYLIEILNDTEINNLLRQNQFEAAKQLGLTRLKIIASG